MTQATITLHTLSSVDRGELIHAINAAYADYFVPIQLSTQSFHTLCHHETVQLESSQAAIADGQIVGMGLLGIRETRGWIGGMGVIPEYRKQGIGRAVMQALITEAKRLGLETLQLEVLVQNAQALKLYQSLGFTITRDLLVMACPETIELSNYMLDRPDITLTPEDPEVLIETLPDFSCVPNPWQREIRAKANLSAVAARRKDTLAIEGGCLFVRGNTVIGLQHLAASSQEIGLSLLATLSQNYAVSSFSYLNVAENDPMLPALLKAGFQEQLRQHEMILRLHEEVPV